MRVTVGGINLPSTVTLTKKWLNQLWFNYDANGKLAGFTAKLGTAAEQTYYYTRNVQGDITGFYDEDGDIAAMYNYDAWGKCSTIYSTNSTIANLNPFRYRGYYYDKETGYYYLNSRYYNPEWCRFINADGYVSTGQGLLSNNMFAYCGNNPVNCYDPSGKSFLAATICGVALWKIGAAIVGLVSTFILADAIAKNPPTFPSISLPKAEVKSKSETKDIAQTLPKPTAKDPIHHIVAKADHRAEESRQILRDVGIEPVTDSRNLVVLLQSYHVSLHTTAYHNYVTERLRPVAGDKAGVEATLASLKAEILARSAAGIRWD